MDAQHAMTNATLPFTQQHLSIFETTRQRFLQNLSADHRLKITACTSPDAVISSVRHWGVISQNRQKGKKYLSILQKLSDTLKPYFRVIDLLVNSNPEYASLVWGGLNLILQLASNYASFFDKLNKSLDRITTSFPAYQELEKIVRNRNLNLSSVVSISLAHVYQDIFEFLHDIIGIFAGPEGRKKRSPSIFGSLAFKSFDTRFDNILKDLQHHREVLALEISVLNLKLTTEEAESRRAEHVQIFAAQNTYSQNITHGLGVAQTMIEEVNLNLNELSRKHMLQMARNWLSPSAYASELEEAKSHREEGSGNWIFEEPVFEVWCQPPQVSSTNSPSDQEDSSILWIHGAPGSGKTVLAASIIEELLEDLAQLAPSESLVLYHFFKDTNDCNDPVTAYRSILSQILQISRNNNEVMDMFSFAMMDVSSGQKTATVKDLLELLKLCLNSFDEVSIIVDGIDECTGPEQFLEELTSYITTRGVKLLLLSRPNVSVLLRQIPTQYRLSMKNDGVKGDISRYSRRRIEVMKRQRLLDDSASIEQLTEHLVQGAGHMFLKSPVLTPKQRSKIITSIDLPEGLDPMYNRILSLITHGPDVEIRFAATIFTWLATARRALKSSELREVVRYARIGSHCDNEDDYTNVNDFHHAVVMSCAGLVELSLATEETTTKELHFQFIHLSAKNFITSLQQGTVSVPLKLRPYLQSETISNLCLAALCLRYVRYTVSQKSTFGQNSVNENVDMWQKNAPLTSYASAHWIHHLTVVCDIHQAIKFGLTQREPDIFETLKSFVEHQSSIMTWIESSYALQHSSLEKTSHAFRVAQLTKWCEDLHSQSLCINEMETTDILDILKTFCSDLQRLHEAMGASLEQSPRLIWEEVSSFVPSRFWLTNKATTVTLLNPSAQAGTAQSREALLSVSESSLSHSLVAVLSIWPSKDFEQFWDGVGDEVSLQVLHSCCKSWVSRFELFSVAMETPQTVLECSIEIPQSEVWLAIRQSLRKEAAGNWRFHFPIAISESLQSFTILQTLYLASPPEYEGPATGLTLRSVTLELDLLLGLEAKWWELLRHPPVRSINIKRGGPKDMGTFYTYRFTFDSNGNRAYFTDYHQLQQSTLAVLSISDSGSVTVLNKTSASPEWDEDKIAFHPTEPLLFIYRSRKIKVWWYKQDGSTSEPIDFYNPRCGYHDGLQEMAVSKCGRFLVMSFPKRPPIFQRILSIPDAIDDVSIKVPSTNVATISPDTIVTFKAGEVLNRPDISFSKDGSYIALEVVKSAHNIKIHKWTGDRSSNQEIQQRLTALPTWNTIENTKISVRWPSDKEKMVKIVMDQASRKYYSHATAEVSRSGPVVIQRDLQVLNPPLLNGNARPADHPDSIGRKRPLAALQDYTSQLAIDQNRRLRSAKGPDLPPPPIKLVVGRTKPRKKALSFST